MILTAYKLGKSLVTVKKAQIVTSPLVSVSFGTEQGTPDWSSCP